MKKKNIWIGITLCGLLLTGTACNDNKEEFLNDFSTILSIKQNGEVPLTLYKTGQDTQHHLVINKGGSNYGASTSVEVEVLNEDALKLYNSENSTNYVALPASCYTLERTQFSFSSNEAYKHLNITLKTDAIYKLANVGGTYVLPIMLSQSPDSINSQKKHTFIKPTVVIPSIYFGQTGYVANEMTPASANQATFRLPITMPFANQWNFDCTVEVDESLLTDYNTENSEDYKLLPATAYSLASSVSFAPNINSKDVDIKVDHTKLTYGYYVLPIRLSGCTQPAIEIDETKNTCLYGIDYVPLMTQVNLTEDMLSSNAKEPSEGSLGGLLDNNMRTYFHSAWSVAVADAHYLQVALAKESTAFRFDYRTRYENGNAAPTEIVISGSADGTSFTPIATLNKNLPLDGGNALYSSKVLISEEAFKHLRFTITQNKNGGKFFVWSEFRLWIN
ncbi:MAG: carbohydrate-binding protein [Paludibacter sp. 47-17]|nr:MAG: carbohydrate-binding protein [Paludibacter sp. 47-17]